MRAFERCTRLGVRRRVSTSRHAPLDAPPARPLTPLRNGPGNSAPSSRWRWRWRWGSASHSHESHFGPTPPPGSTLRPFLVSISPAGVVGFLRSGYRMSVRADFNGKSWSSDVHGAAHACQLERSVGTNVGTRKLALSVSGVVLTLNVSHEISSCSPGAAPDTAETPPTPPTLPLSLTTLGYFLGGVWFSMDCVVEYGMKQVK